jgi:glycosyltransferase involved in cell wall biosynthesis
MKIIHFTTVHSRYDIRIFSKQCVSLAEENHNVTLYVADGKGDELKKGVKIIDIGCLTGKRIKRIFIAQKSLKEKLSNEQADIYQFHDPELLRVGKWLRNQGKVVVYDSHEDVPKQILYKAWLGPHWFRKILAKKYNQYEKKIVQRLSGVISVIDEITENFICSHKITIRNYPLVNIYNNYVRTYVDKKKQLVYVGSLSKERGILDCIKAMRYLPLQYKLILIGKFSSNSFEEECKSLKEWERVVFKGFLSIKEVAPILGESLVGLCILHPEENYKMSLPTKGFEYIAAGSPVVLSDFEYWKPFFIDCGSFVEPSNPKLIAESIKELIENESNYTKIQSNGLVNAKKYSWESEKKKLIGFYESILSNTKFKE